MPVAVVRGAASRAVPDMVLSALLGMGGSVGRGSFTHEA